MQDVTPWPDQFDVSQPVARVLVDGEGVEVESVTVSSELESAMPERVVAGGGITAATGETNILRPYEVSESGFNPWGDAARFADAEEIVVEAGFRDPATEQIGCARQITSQVESLAGGALSNVVAMNFMDRTASLDQDITIEPLLLLGPPLVDFGPRLGVGLSPFYVTNRVLRHCGFYSTPPMINQALLSVPLFGSAIPERGTLSAASRMTGDTGAAATYFATPWGMGLRNGELRYTPNLGSRGHGRLTSTLHVSFHRDAFTGGSPATSRINMHWGSWENGININLNASGTVAVLFRTNGTPVTVANLAAHHVEDSEAFTVLITPSGEVTIYASNGATATGSSTLPPPVTSSNLDEVSIQVPENGHRLGGIQVAFTTTRNHDFVRTAHVQDPTYWATTAFPAQIAVNCLELLKAHAEAELAAMWIDEFGHFRWRSRRDLRASTPVGTLTSQDHIFDLPWDFPVRSMFSRVQLEHDSPTITRRLTATITVSDAGGATLGNADTEDKFFEPPADEDWHMVQDPQWMGGSVNNWHIRRGRGSYRGGIIVDDSDEERIAYSSRLVQSWRQINPQRWLLSSTAQNLNSDEFIDQNLLDRPDLYGKFAGENLPIIRAKGLVQWEHNTYMGSHRGPRWAPVFTHQVGPWLQNPNALADLADYLGEHLTRPEPILRDIAIVPDPRIQLGDVFWLEDRTAYHVRLRVVVMGKTLTYQASPGGDEMTQRITCRVIEAQRLQVSYDEFQAAWANQDYAALEAAWGAATYQDLAADPLEGN